MDGAGLRAADLPGFWRDADAGAARGQRWSLLYVRVQLLGSVMAAAGGAVTWDQDPHHIGAALVIAGFAVAFAAEVLGWSHQPEKLWYEGRALAESAKTLAWRYAVGADPFPAALPEAEARELLRSRLGEVSRGSHEQVTIAAPDAVVTEGMEELRRQGFATRRAAYLEGRTLDQQQWYAVKASRNQKRATSFRLVMVIGELGAIVAVSVGVFAGWDFDVVDWAGALAALVAAGAAWVAVKQYSPLAAAYSTAARELALQADRLRLVAEADWPRVAADAEEAISREHTLWVASRTGGPAAR